MFDAALRATDQRGAPPLRRNHPLFNVSDSRITADKLLEFDYANRRQAEMGENSRQNLALEDQLPATTWKL